MIYVTLAALLTFAFIAVLLKDNLLSVLSLASVSAFLSILFFQIGAPVAGVFELSVGAGLITVLVVLTISFIQERKEKGPGSRLVWLMLCVLVTASFLFVFQTLSPFLVGYLPVSSTWSQVGEIFWKVRSFDLLPQVLIILSAAFGILALLRQKSGGHEGGQK